MNDETNDKAQKDRNMSDEKNRERRREHGNIYHYNKERSALRIESAKQELLEEDTDPIRRLRAIHTIIEETESERIAVKIEELKSLRAKHNDEIELLWNTPALRDSKKAQLRNWSQQRIEFTRETKRLIQEIMDEWSSNKQESILSLLPDGEEPFGISYNEIANSLNEQGHKTLHDREWTRAAVKMFIEKNGGTKLKKAGHEKDTLLAANLTRKQRTDEFAIKMRDEYLKSIDLTQNHLTIAKELNKRGIKTRTGGEWGNVAVKRLLERIEELRE